MWSGTVFIVPDGETILEIQMRVHYAMEKVLSNNSRDAEAHRKAHEAAKAAADKNYKELFNKVYKETYDKAYKAALIAAYDVSKELERIRGSKNERQD